MTRDQGNAVDPWRAAHLRRGMVIGTCPQLLMFALLLWGVLTHDDPFDLAWFGLIVLLNLAIVPAELAFALLVFLTSGSRSAGVGIAVVAVVAALLFTVVCVEVTGLATARAS